MKNEVLDNLVKNKDIKYYEFENLDIDGNIGKSSCNRNSQRLVLVFNSGKKIVIDTMCSGCLENTIMIINDCITNI